MKINDNTRISELIKADKAAIEAIASVAKPFHRLRNPVLRKVMAPRVTIAEAAKMGGCTVEAIAESLRPLGFEYEQAGKAPEEPGARPGWLAAAQAGNVVTLDVRGIIESGTDPLKEILSAFKQVPPEGILCVVNSFIPTPLLHLLRQEKAADSYVETVSENEFHTYFLKKPAGKEPEPPVKSGVFMDDPASFEAVLRLFPQEKIREADVRGLEMPLPMQAILEALETLPGGHALYVHHKRVPVYLLDELSGKGFGTHILKVDESNVKIILFKVV